MKWCEKEPQVVSAAIGGDLSESLLRHVEVCQLCSEAVTAVRNLGHLAGEPFADPLPSAALVWWRAALKKQQFARRRTQMPLIWMRWIGWAVAVLAAIAIGVRAAPLALSMPPLLWVGLGVVAMTCFSSGCALYAWSRSDS